MDTKTSIAENYSDLLQEIGRLSREAGRDPAEIRLVVVTKGHPLEPVQEVVTAGARWLGENYLEEALPKMEALGAENRVEWHMIGHVQSRKAEAVAGHFAWVHSVDRIKIADRLNRFAGEIGRRLPVLLECNVSGEESKYGWKAWREADWPALVEAFSPLVSLPNLDVRGLMTMAPYFDEPEPARPYFQRLRRLRDYLAGAIPGPYWQELSMGMSGDFPVAIQEGATILRIGTRIMGPRPEI